MRLAGSRRWPARRRIRAAPSGLRSWMKRSAASPSINARWSYFATWRACLTRRRRPARLPGRDSREPPVSRAAAAARPPGAARTGSGHRGALRRDGPRRSAALPAALIKHAARLVTSSPAAGPVPVAVTAVAEGVIQMMWLARLKPLAVVATALILATAGVAVQGRQKSTPEGALAQAKAAFPPAAGVPAAAVPDLAANRALAREQLALIDQALAMLNQLYENSTIRFTDPRFSLWARRKVETLRKIGAGKAEIVAALESYINRLKQEEAATQNDHQSGRATQVDVHDIQYRRMEAEIWLNEEKAR